MKYISIFLTIAFIIIGCQNESSTEKYQSKRNEILDVKDRVCKIDMHDVYIGPISRLYLIDSLLLITDPQTPEFLLHIFNKNDFSHIACRIHKGRGPGEIVNIGHPVISNNHHFFLIDNNKRVLYDYDLNKLIADPDYIPSVQLEFAKKRSPTTSKFLNDSILLGTIMEPIGNASFKQLLAKWNIRTGEITPMPYEHPSIERKRMAFDRSIKYNIYVESYHHHDLFSICTLDGKLIYNVYGPNWDDHTSNSMFYYDTPSICKNKIIIPYSGKNFFDGDKWYPTMFHIFDLEGNYLKTLDVGYKISDYCYDAENNRLIMALNDVIQFAYLDLDGII